MVAQQPVALPDVIPSHPHSGRCCTRKVFTFTPLRTSLMFMVGCSLRAVVMQFLTYFRLAGHLIFLPFASALQATVACLTTMMVTMGSPGGWSGTLWAVGCKHLSVRSRCLLEKQRKLEAAMVSCSSTESKKRSFVRWAPPTRRRRPLGSDGSQNSFIAGAIPTMRARPHGQQNARKICRARWSVQGFGRA